MGSGDPCAQATPTPTPTPTPSTPIPYALCASCTQATPTGYVLRRAGYANANDNAAGFAYVLRAGYANDFDLDNPLWHKRPNWFGVVRVPRFYDLRFSYVVWQKEIDPYVL